MLNMIKGEFNTVFRQIKEAENMLVNAERNVAEIIHAIEITEKAFTKDEEE